MANDRRELTPRELQRQRRKEQVQRRRLVAGLVLLGLIIIIIVAATTCGGGSGGGTTTTSSGGESTSTTLGSAVYTADLTGDDTDATGTLELTYDSKAEELSFELRVKALDSPSVATIYEGAEGEAGTAVYSLFGGPAETGPYTGVLNQGVIDAADLTGSLAGGSVGDLIALINDGRAYVSVGTTDKPVDAIRGQISEANPTETSVDESTESTEEGTSTTEEGNTTTTKKSTSTTKKTTTTT